MTAADELQLILQVKEGSHDAFRILVERLWSMRIILPTALSGIIRMPRYCEGIVRPGVSMDPVIPRRCGIRYVAVQNCHQSFVEPYSTKKTYGGTGNSFMGRSDAPSKQSH